MKNTCILLCAAAFAAVGCSRLPAADPSGEEAVLTVNLSGLPESKATAGTDPSDTVSPAPVDALDSPLNWKTVKAENTLTATAEIDNDTLCFELVLEPEEGVSPDAAFEKALAWLKTVTVR